MPSNNETHNDKIFGIAVLIIFIFFSTMVMCILGFMCRDSCIKYKMKRRQNKIISPCQGDYHEIL